MAQSILWTAIALLGSIAVATPETLQFTQFTDHQAASGTFSQRVYINSDFAKSDSAPVIFQSGHVYRTNFSDEYDALFSNAKALAGKIGAHYVYVEHRFTGDSWPMPDLSNSALKVLNTFQVLRDMRAVQVNLTKNRFPKSKWIVVGASYTAELALLYSLQYPGAVAGTYASAPAVIGVGRYLPEYSERVLMNAPLKCRHQIVAALDYAIAHPQEIRDLLYLRKYSSFPNSQLLIPLRHYLSELAQYGDMGSFCDELAEEKEPEPQELFYFLIQKMLDKHPTEVERLELTPYAATLGIEQNSPEEFLGTRRFLFLTCSEHGARTSRLESNPLTRAWPKAGSTEKHCEEIFGKELTSVPDDSLIGARLLQGLPELRNTLIIDSSNDTWRVNKVFEGRVYPGIRYHQMEGESHCSEFPSSYREATPEIKKAQQLLFSHIESWMN